MKDKKWTIDKYENEIEISTEDESLVCTLPINNEIYSNIANFIVLAPEMKRMLIMCYSALRRENPINIKELELLIDKLNSD